MQNAIINNRTNIRKVGRPTAITSLVLRKLASAFRLGLSDHIACQFAQIAPSTFYRNMQIDENFKSVVKCAKAYLILMAASVVYNAIANKNDVSTARWLLEKKEPEAFGSIRQSRN